jgi:hypothetical protein
MEYYYAVLQLDEHATPEEIKKAYRRLAKQYHPDVNKSPDAHDRFIEITEAYEFLINHWPGHITGSGNKGSQNQGYTDYRWTEEYERFRKESREKAQRQARMRYEKFRKQHEAFQESGLNDIGLWLTVFIRIVGIVLLLFLFFTPIVSAYYSGWPMIFLAFLTWPFAAIIAWYIHDNRKRYFIPGQFYYTPQRIRHLYSDTHQTAQPCYYCRSKYANSQSYRIELLKLKDLKYGSKGFRQHTVNYVNQQVAIMVPRSRKAFILHSVSIFTKLTAILGCLFFLDISSILWRIIIGMLAGGLVSRLLLLLTRTRSNISYLVSYGMILRVGVWLLSIFLVSRFSFDPFDIATTDSIYFVITSIIIFDSFLMQLVGFIFGKYAALPVTMQYPDVMQKFHEGYSVYNDVPVISVVYPIFRWVFG